MWQKNGSGWACPAARRSPSPKSNMTVVVNRGSIRRRSAVSLGLGLLVAVCGLAGCGSGDRGNAAGVVPPPKTSPQAETDTADDGGAAGDAQPTAPTSSHPIDQTEEGALYRQAVAALDAGDVAGAMAARLRLEGHPQYGVLAEAVDAIALVKKGEYEEAMRAAERLSRIPALQSESYMIAGEVFHGQGNWKQAIGAFHGALKLHPELTRAHRWLGAIYHDTGAMQLATDHLRKAAELDPSDYRSRRLCGLIQYEYQKYDEAVDDYQQALKRSPPQRVATEIRLELADSLRELRRVDEALATLAECKDSAEVAVMRATCYETGGKLDEALREARRAVELAPQNAKGNYVLGKVYLSLRRAEDAIAPLRFAVDADPTNHEPRFLLGRALLQTGHTAEGKARTGAVDGVERDLPAASRLAHPSHRETP